MMQGLLILLHRLSREQKNKLMTRLTASTIHGGERPIGLLCMLYRFYGKFHRASVWEGESWSGAQWDKAVRGNSAAAKLALVSLAP